MTVDREATTADLAAIRARHDEMEASGKFYRWQAHVDRGVLLADRDGWVAVARQLADALAAVHCVGRHAELLDNCPACKLEGRRDAALAAFRALDQQETP